MKKFRFLFQIMADSKVGGCKTFVIAIFPNNEMTPFASELWFFDIFWLTSNHILKLGVAPQDSHGIFSHERNQEKFHCSGTLSHDVELKSPAEDFFTLLD